MNVVAEFTKETCAISEPTIDVQAAICEIGTP
jgi:hypothetical protein